jgi:hypothetical protein
MEIRYQDLPHTPHQPLEPIGIDRVYDYLRKRGVNKDDIEHLGLLILRGVDIGRSTDDRAAIVFPHRNLRGEYIDWWSARMVELVPATGFAALTAQARPKMLCPPKEAPAAYLAPQFGAPWAWATVPKGSVIYVHESAIKAINGAKLGHYSIGLNGVEGWASKTHDVALVAQIKDLPWKSKALKCVVVFDSDAQTNDNVMRAVLRFNARMQEVFDGSVEVRYLPLPAPPTGLGIDKWGFDDFCAHVGPESAREFLDSWKTASQPVEVSPVDELKLKLNQEVLFVNTIKRVLRVSDGTIMNKGDFTEMCYAHYLAEVGDKKVSVPQLWLKWEHRRTVERIVYSPGLEPIGKDYYNTWPGMGAEPVAGDASPWLALLERAVPDEALRRWLLCWFAYPLQHLGEKLTTYVYLYGPAGCGKGALLAPFFGIYGDRNAVQVGRERLISDFNSIYASRQFVHVDEIHSGADRDGLALTNKIKMLTTADKLTVNTKGSPEFVIENHLNLVVTGNYSDGLKLDDDDRRCCVIKAASPASKEESYWRPYWDWCGSTEGQQALYAYLLGVDLAGFNPHGWAPMTREKSVVTEASRSGLEAWVHTLRNSPEEVLDTLLVGAPALSVDQLAVAYVGEDMLTKVTPGLKMRLGALLSDLGFRRTGTVRVQEKLSRRLWVIDTRLANAGDLEVRDAYIKWKGGMPEPKY